MKKIISSLALSALILASSNSFAQLRKIPGIVTDSFAVKYPKATNVEWGDKVTGFEATFDSKGHKEQATFSSKGVWKKTEVTMSVEEIPAAVKDGLQKSKYNDWEDRIYVFLTEVDGTELYRILVKKNDLQKKYLYFNKEGQLIKDLITL